MIFGPRDGGQSLYYSTYANGGEVHRIDYVGNVNRAPTAAATAQPTSGPAPLSVSFDTGASSDPDAGDSLTFLWTFGDGTPQESTTSKTVTHTYPAGIFTAEASPRITLATFLPVATSRFISGNTPPAPTIDTPLASDTFSVGQTVTLSGHASDAEDGSLPRAPSPGRSSAITPITPTRSWGRSPATASSSPARARRTSRRRATAISRSG